MHRPYSTFKVGDFFIEEAYGIELLCRVTEETSESIMLFSDKEKKQWSWKAENVTTGEIFDFLITEDFEHYGPNIKIIGE